MNNKNCGVCDDFKLAFNTFKKTKKNNETQFEGPTKTELGNATWLYLHTMSKYYAENPTEEEQKRMIDLINNIAYFFPCKNCSEHFKEYIKLNSPNVISNKTLMLWMCTFHNDVNKRLGKPEYRCE